MTDQTKKGWVIPIITSIITSLAVLAGSWFAFESESSIAESNRLESAFKRIEYLETQMRQQQANSNAKIIELTSQVFRLQSQLNKDLNIMDMFEGFMDGLPFEAWLKEVKTVDNEVVIQMLLINKQYEYTYGVTRYRYAGVTDAEIWGEDVAETFRKHDLQVLRSKSSKVFYQTYPVNPDVPYGKTVRKMVVKVFLELVDGRQMIFGMAIDIPNEQQEEI